MGHITGTQKGNVKGFYLQQELRVENEKVKILGLLMATNACLLEK